MSLDKNIAYNAYREILILHSFTLMKVAHLIRERFNIFQAIDPDFQVDFRIPILPGSIISNALSLKHSSDIKKFCTKLEINHDTFLKFVLNDELPRFSISKSARNVIKDRLIPVFQNLELSYGLYIRVDDQLSNKALIELKTMAKRIYPDLYGSSKRMQIVSDDKHAVYYEINQIMKKIYKSKFSKNKPTLSDQETTLFRAALSEYTDDYFDKNSLDDENDDLYSKTIESFRQSYINTENAYQIPKIKGYAALLIDTTHKPQLS